MYERIASKTKRSKLSEVMFGWVRSRFERSRATFLPFRLVKTSATKLASRYAVLSGNQRIKRHPAK